VTPQCCLETVARAARVYCEVVAESSATQQERETGGLWVSRLLDVRTRRELAYVEMHRALRAAGYAPACPPVGVTRRVTRLLLAIHAADEAAADVLETVRRIASPRVTS
jgi:hypothetical protein